MKIEEKYGEIIGFEEPDYTTPIYIRGHVKPEEATEALAKHCSDMCGASEGTCDDHCPATLRHCWARWQRATVYDGHDGDYSWQTRCSKTPGWAKVTKVDTVCQVRALEERQATEYWMRSLIARRFTGAQVVDAYGTPKACHRHAHIAFVWRGLRVWLRPFVQGDNTTIEPARGYMTRAAMWDIWAMRGK